MGRDLLAWLSIVALTAAPGLGFAQKVETETDAADSGYRITGLVEGGVAHTGVSGGRPRWNDQFLRAGFQLSVADRIAAEVSHQNHFGDAGTFLSASYTRNLNDRWYGSLSAGTSSGGFFLPRFRVDILLCRKWLENASLVTYIGFSYLRSKSAYFDRSVLLGVTYYFGAPWIVELGSRLNESNPGSVFSWRGFAAVTYGTHQHHYFTLRYESGREAYQLVTVGAALVDFASQEASFTWRQWISDNWGFNLRATHYAGPYRRTGAEVGIFYEF